MRRTLLTFLFLIVAIILKGQVVFQKTYGGVGNETAYVVRQTFDEGFILAGITNSFGSQFGDLYLIKTSADGDTLWTKTYANTHLDYRDIQQTSDSGYIIICLSYQGPGGFDIGLIKTDALGTAQWTKAYGGIYDEMGYSVKQTSDGGYVIAGSTDTFGSGWSDCYLIKTDSNGDTLFTRTYGGIQAHEEGNSIQQTFDGGYVIAGSTSTFAIGQDDVYLLKTDSSGLLQWSKTFRGLGDEKGNSVSQTNDGGYMIGGWSRSFGPGNYSAYLVKTDSSGTLEWSKIYGE